MENGEGKLPRDLQDTRELVRAALGRRRQAIVYALAERFHQMIRFETSEASPENEADQGDWTPIESLSQLRSVVVGRFQNLKQKWIAAGLPLREHRGDRSGEASLDEEGWLALSIWINKQGFEARLVSNNDTYLFEIRSSAN